MSAAAIWGCNACGETRSFTVPSSYTISTVHVCPQNGHTTEGYVCLTHLEAMNDAARMVDNDLRDMAKMAALRWKASESVRWLVGPPHE